MYRVIEEYLSKWKEKKDGKPLLIKGARQVGKSYSIRKFAKENFDSYIEINLESDLYMRDVFAHTLDIQEIISMYQLKHPNVIIDKEHTLIFLDEIQASTNALTSLKFFAMEHYKVIASGSLLGVALSHTTSFPVGYVEIMELQPMSFEEFLYALGVDKSIIEILHQCFLSGEPVMEPLHEQMNMYFKQYMICGGMPEVVKEYVKTKDYAHIKKIQKQILWAYQADLAKYGENIEKVRANECFQSIPLQLAKDNKKFQYKVVSKGGNARTYGTSLKWLQDCGIIRCLYRLDNLTLPLEAHKDLSAFKVYMNDTGLLMAMFEEDLAYTIMQNDLMIYKGAIFENIVFQCLHIHHEQSYYYEYRGNYEIDFVIYHDHAVLPIEVKSATNTKAKSLKTVVERYSTPLAYKLSLNNVNTQHETIKCFPLYMLMFI